MAHGENVARLTRSGDSTKRTSGDHPILQAENLHKSYGSREALRGLTFSLSPGRILGFLGPNGAGKTTAIRILTTILQADAGHFTIDGIPSTQPERIRQRIGVLPESLGFHKHMSGLECITFFGRLYGQSAAAARANGEALLKDVGLETRARSLVGTYSRGMRQRLGIARALVNSPAVVVLDEPTLGLDPRGQQELLAIVRWIARERNAGVILCSHLLPEVESVCDDVVILSSGSVVARGTAAEVIGSGQRPTQRNSIRIQVPPGSAAQAQRVLEGLPNVRRVTGGGGAGWLAVSLVTVADGTAIEDQRVTNRVLDALIRADILVLSFGADGSRLQDVFLDLTDLGTKEQAFG